jgi:outer membrane receptor protein involved in Fe transport
VPLGFSFFHPSGWSTFVTGTYYNQDIRSGGRTGRDDFFLVDAGINYRLPKRYGFITVGATNLFDTQFKYYERDQNNSRIQPKRTVFGKITIALP